MRALLIVLAASSLARAQDTVRKPLPSYVPMPPGFALFNGGGRDVVVDYGRDMFDYAPGPGQPFKHVNPEGHNWILSAKATPTPATRLDQAAVNALARPGLAAQGWEVLAERPWIIARREKSGVVSWLKLEGNSDYLSVRVLEQASRSRTIALPAPGPHAEDLKPDAEPPYLAHFPGSVLRTAKLLPQSAVEVRVPGEKDGTWVGRPLWQAEYRGPPDMSPFEFNLTYSEALTKAGWKVLLNTGGSSTGDAQLDVHFANASRDLWAKIHATNGGYTVSLADAGADADVKRLQDALARDGHVALYGIYFDSDSSVLKPESEATLSQIVKLLAASPALAIGIEGHTDNTGARPHNQTLSEQRAASVVRYLVAHGVAAARLASAGFADTRPVADNGSAEGRAKNRRVELAKR